LIARRERPHPGAQLSFTDLDGHRFQCFITDQPRNDLAALEARHRAHAIIEDRVPGLKSTGLSNLPFSAFEPSQAWLEAALCAHDLTVWSQLLLFDGEHAVCEPKRLRYRLLHVAGKLTRHARRLSCTCPPTGLGQPPSPARSSVSPPRPPERRQRPRPRRHSMRPPAANARCAKNVPNGADRRQPDPERARQSAPSASHSPKRTTTRRATHLTGLPTNRG
jgi:hypothetical protein